MDGVRKNKLIDKSECLNNHLKLIINEKFKRYDLDHIVFSI